MFDPNRLGTPQASHEFLSGGRPSAWTGQVTIVGGCGHVGLPLGMAFAKAGIRVELLDTSLERVEQVNRGTMPFKEDGADELLPELIKSGLLSATTDPESISRAEGVIVTIGTPVGDF